MPSSKPILADIYKFKLNPAHAHSKITAGGRLSPGLLGSLVPPIIETTIGSEDIQIHTPATGPMIAVVLDEENSNNLPNTEDVILPAETQEISEDTSIEEVATPKKSRGKKDKEINSA